MVFVLDDEQLSSVLSAVNNVVAGFLEEKKGKSANPGTSCIIFYRKNENENVEFEIRSGHFVNFSLQYFIFSQEKPQGRRYIGRYKFSNTLDCFIHISTYVTYQSHSMYQNTV